MSNTSGDSTGTSFIRGRGRFSRVLKKCWCGEAIVSKISKSDVNPYKRYFRCAAAVQQKLINDNHTFMWVDEAVLNELEALALRTERLEQEVRQNSMEADDEKGKKLHMKIEKEICERVEEVLLEAKTEMKRMLFLVCL
ncbi:uncharacterized protein At4g04775-like [Eutrema salsugineum]|uniref:uncharacterized protein At4g04775-like n=1 Tax=Eutrema salsugineum TaxID=72664 RepID=UPI000CED0737|nr:uncharacterized protein At4g04775-like [Eutrema salsugineum]